MKISFEKITDPLRGVFPSGGDGLGVQKDLPAAREGSAQAGVSHPSKAIDHRASFQSALDPETGADADAATSRDTDPPVPVAANYRFGSGSALDALAAEQPALAFLIRASRWPSTFQNSFSSSAKRLFTAVGAALKGFDFEQALVDIAFVIFALLFVAVSSGAIVFAFFILLCVRC